jgi:hypothetical protein
MAEQFDTIYWRGQGPAFLAERDASGNPLGLEFVGDIDTIEGSANISTTKVKENVSGQRLTAAVFNTDSEYPITINFKSAKPKHLARALQADLTVKTAGSVTDEAVTGHHDKFLKLAHVKCSNLVLTNDAGAITYVADTDYVFYGDEGMVEILSTGSITDGQALLADYDYAAQKHISANPGNKDYMLVFPGINTANSDKRGRCTIFKLKIDPAFLSLIQQDTEGALSVNAEMQADTLRASGNQLYQWEYED